MIDLTKVRTFLLWVLPWLLVVYFFSQAQTTASNFQLVAEEITKTLSIAETCIDSLGEAQTAADDLLHALTDRTAK